MKTTGMVRKVDELGRLVLPIEMRRVLNISVKDPIEIYVDGDSIILRKHQPFCLFCGCEKDTLEYHGKRVCKACIKRLQEQL